jgi:hypothetical protein
LSHVGKKTEISALQDTIKPPIVFELPQATELKHEAYMSMSITKNGNISHIVVHNFTSPYLNAVDIRL